MHVEGSASILALIELNHLTKTFKGKTQTVDALKDINLHIEQGNIFGIIGMSGAGKSTLVRCINFLEQPTSGSVVIDGKDLASLSPKALRQLRQQVSMIFQHFNLLSQRDVRGNIAFAMEIAGMKRPQIEKRIDELLEIVGLTDRQHNYPSQLSGGQQQRVAIARALATNPKIILCDEATSALDPTTTTSILNLLREINRKMGITIVIITHEMAVIKEICDRVAVIEGGVIKEQGRVIDVFTNPQSETMKEFVKSVINMELPEGIKKLGVTNQPSPDRDMLVRFRFKGAATNEPLVVNVARKFNLDVSVLYGNIDYIQDVPFGYLIVVIMGDMKAQTEAYSYIKTQPIESEVLGYVPRTH